MKGLQHAIPIAESEELEIPLSEQAYAVLRRDILSGAIAPGSKLKIDELQRRYSISSTPLREALNRLVAEQIVSADDRRGFRAAPISLADLRDITKYRIILENSALEQSIAVGTTEWEAEIVSAFHRLDASNKALSPKARSFDTLWNERHKNFHISLLDACGSSRLLSACISMFDHSQRYRNLWAQRRIPPRNASGEHKRLMEAVLRRDKKAAKEMLTSHIQRAADQVSEFLE